MGAMVLRHAQPKGMHLAVMPRLSNNRLFFVCQVLTKAAKVPPISSHFRNLGSIAYPHMLHPSHKNAYTHSRLLNAHNVTQCTLWSVTSIQVTLVYTCSQQAIQS